MVTLAPAAPHERNALRRLYLDAFPRAERKPFRLLCRQARRGRMELLTLRGVRASFVLFKHDTGVNLSARSLGEINVQLIMEKLGGGGNSTTAGGQIPDGTVDAVREQLIAAIDQYLEG